MTVLPSNSVDADGRRTRHLVVTVHGIRTFGDWQERLERLLDEAAPEIHISHYKYGYFSVLAFCVPFLRWLVTLRFRRELLRQSSAGRWDRVDIVAHSFGTHLVGWALYALRADKRVRVHTVVLAGSVLKPGFPWRDLIAGRVGRVINECGIHDSVLIANQLFVLFTGMAGRVGFGGMTGEAFRNRFWSFGHSGYFVGRPGDPDEFMRRYWVPLLTTEVPTPVIAGPPLPSALRGFTTFLLNNTEPIKLAAVVALLGIPLLTYIRLYDTSEQRRLVGLSRQLASESQTIVRSDPQRALLLAVEAARIDASARRGALGFLRSVPELIGVSPKMIKPVAAAEHALRQAIAQMRGVTLEAFQEPVNTVGVSVDGSNIVAVGRNGSIALWTQTRELDWQLAWRQPGTSAITAATFSPATFALAIASMDGAIAFWNRAALLTEQQPIMVPTRERISSLAISPDGAWMAAGGESGTSYVWETGPSGMAKSPRVFGPASTPWHGSGGAVVTFSHDNRRLVAGGPAGAVHWWNLALADPPATTWPERTWTRVATVAASPSGRWLASGGGPQEGGWLLDMTAIGSARARIIGSGVFLTTALGFSADDRYLATASDADDSVAVWELASGRQVIRAFDGGQAVTIARNEWLITGAHDHAVRMRRIADGGSGQPTTLIGHGAAVTSIAADASVPWIVTGAADGTLYVWDLLLPFTQRAREIEPAAFFGRDSGQPLGSWRVDELTSDATPNRRFAFSSDDRILVDVGRTLTVCDLTILRSARACREEKLGWPISRTVVTPDGRRLLHATSTGIEVNSASVESDRPFVLLGPANGPLLDASPNGRWVIARGKDSAALWDTEHRDRPPVTLNASLTRWSSRFSTFSPDSRLLLIPGSEGSLEVRDLAQTAALVQRLDWLHLGEHLTEVKFSRNAAWVALGGTGGLAGVWRIGAQRNPFELQLSAGKGDRRAAVAAFSHDEMWIATGGDADTVRIWRLTAEGPILASSLPGQRGGVSALAFSGDDSDLFVATGSGEIRSWRLDRDKQGTESLLLPYRGNIVTHLLLSPKGGWLAARDRNDVLHVWTINPTTLISRGRLFAGRNLSKSEWIEHLGGEEYRRTFPNLPDRR